MTARLNLLPDPRFERLQAELHTRVSAAAAALDRETFPDFFDPIMRGTLRTGFAEARADEGTVWLVDRERGTLVGVINTGSRSEEIAGGAGHVQPLSSGVISMVFRSEQPFCENRMQRHQLQDKTLDRKLGVVTSAMIAVPFYYAREIRGVISCVQLQPAPYSVTEEGPGFPQESLRAVQFSAAVLSRLLDHALLSATIGWSAP